MKKYLIASLIALTVALVGASSVNADFKTNLTVGSTGTDVSALQAWLIGKGFDIPAISSGAAKAGYFGSQTKAAVSAYQKSVGLPSYGFFGPLTQAKVNGGTVGTVVVAGCPIGFDCTPKVGTTPATTVAGAKTEGSFTVSQGAQPANDTNVTKNVNVPVYGVKIKAMNSDMSIDRADLEFAVTVNSTTVNPAGFVTNLSAWDGSTLLKSMSLSANDFTKDSGARYYVRMSGIGFIVPKDVEKTLTFTVNTTPVSSADYTRALTVKGYSQSTQNIRGTDGLGLQSYGNDSWTSSFTFQASNNSTLTGTANSSTPKAQTVAVNTTDGVRGVVMQTADFKSTTGDSALTTVRVYVKTDSVSTSAPTALYLYDGSTLLGSGSVTVTSGSGTVDFTNMVIKIPKDITKTLTVKADFPSTAAGVASTTIATSASETNTTMHETADGSTKEVAIASAITGNDIHLYADSAPVWTLSSATASGKAGVVNVASSTIEGTIVLNVKASGGTLTKPVASDFTVFFASSTQLTTNGGTGYTSANGISVTPTITVTPTDSTVADGSSYTVTISGVLYSSNSGFGSSQNLFMAVNNIDSSITKTSGSNTITNQNWGIDNFYTNGVQLTKGTQ